MLTEKSPVDIRHSPTLTASKRTPKYGGSTEGMFETALTIPAGTQASFFSSYRLLLRTTEICEAGIYTNILPESTHVRASSIPCCPQSALYICVTPVSGTDT